MAGIRWGRVLAGGLVAGLIINIGESILNVPLAGEELAQALEARNLPPVGGGAIAYFIGMCFLLGILMVWIYAAVRPRLGPGPKTAVIVALLTWFMTLVWSGGAQVAMGIMPLRLTIFGLGWGLVEFIIASLVGAKLYRE
jgi:apolipoprotein N-acyltransferase